MASVPEIRPGASELAAAYAAVRSRLGLVIAVLALTAVAWWSTADRMAGMDAGPGTDLGRFGWFLGVWVVMMAAMMLPSLTPTLALYTSMTRGRGVSRPVLFAGGYLVIWGLAGVVAYGLFRFGSELFGGQLAWHRGGRWLASAVLVLAAVYQLVPLKDVCLSKCRSPVGFLLGSWDEGRLGALKMGSMHAGWCVGCCWALMAALFALGVMSLTWMALVAALIVLEKTIPWRRPAIWATAAVLLALAIAVLAVPESVPGLVIPSGSHGTAGAMHAMSALDTVRS